MSKVWHLFPIFGDTPIVINAPKTKKALPDLTGKGVIKARNQEGKVVIVNLRAFRKIEVWEGAHHKIEEITL